MTIQVTQVLNTQSFGVWLERTNQIANIISQNTVTADTTSGGSLTTGNSYVNGFFGANYLVVNTQIRGGNLTTNATITIASNTNFSNVVNIAGLVTAAANLNVTGTANVSSTLNIGGNVSLTTSQVFIGNATVNTAINSSSLSVGTGIFANNTRLIVNTSIGLQANNSLGAAGQVLTTNGTGIYWSAVSGGGGGTVTSVGSGNGLTGGPVTTTGSLSVLANTGIVANSSGLFVNSAVLTPNASNITTGTLPWAQAPTNTVNTTGAFTFTGLHTYTNGISFSNTITANGSNGAAGQVLTSSGASGNVYWSTVSSGGGGGGTVTSVGSGDGLTGGPIAISGTLSVLANTGIVANSNGLFVNTAYISSLSVNATNITTGTLDTLRLPATANITTGINVGANLNINTSVLYIGNTSSNLIANSSTLAIGITTVNSTLMSVSAINVSSQVNAATIFTTGIANVNQIYVNNPSVTSIVNGNLTVVGTLQAGTLAYSGTSTGSIIPGTNNSFDIGSTSNVWAKGFFSNLNSNSININGNSSLSGNTSISGILTVTGNSSLSNVSVNGILSINSVHRATNSYTFNNSTSRANVDIFDTATYRSAEYLIQVTDTTTTPRSYQITKMVVLHDNTTPYSTEYSTIYTNQSMGSFDVNIDTANNFQLRFTPSTANAIVKLSRTAITV
jgi:hypothetical protein